MGSPYFGLSQLMSARVGLSTAKEPPKGILLEDPTLEAGESKDTAEPTVSLKDPDSQPASNPSLGVNDIKRPKTTSKQSSRGPKEEFHIFSSLNGNNRYIASLDPPSMTINSGSPDMDTEELCEDLKEIDEFLTNKTNLNDRLVYKNCPTRDRIELYKFLSKQRKEVTEGKDIDRGLQKRYETMVDILNAAELLFKLFLPPGFQGPTVGKYWGALYRLLENVSVTVTTLSEPTAQVIRVGRDSTDVLDWLKLMNRSTIPFRDLLCQASPLERSNIQVSEEFPTAWLHLLLSLAFATEDMQLFDEQIVICNERLEQGMKKIVTGICEHRLSDYVVFAPFDLALLIFFQLSQKAAGSALDISESYLEYLKSLQSDIEAYPLDRGHQDRLVSLKQEISVISETLSQQRSVLHRAAPQLSSMGHRADIDLPQHSRSQEPYMQRREAPPYGVPPPYNSLQPGILGPNGAEGLIMQDSRALLEKRVREFREMQDIASDLGDWNIQKIDSNKDRQEAAIYAFTIVTIIFLPLSTVAGILGMNTYDVRNMPFKQWVFWVTAIPLTVIIIALCLVWAGELGNFWQGFRRVWRNHGTSGWEKIREHEMLDINTRNGYSDDVRRRRVLSRFDDTESSV
ncbi:hypothetical protein B7463_g9343, partial [Scytalidium lignicola]